MAMTHRERAILALEGKQPDYVPTFELAFQLTEEAFGRKFHQGKENDDLPEAERFRMCQENAELFLAIAERYEHSIIMVTIAPSSIFPQRDMEMVWTMREIRKLARERGEDYLLVNHGDGTFGIPMGEELDTMIELLADEEEGKLCALAERALYNCSGRQLFFVEAGFDGFVQCSDYAFNANPFFSPEQFAVYVRPYLARITAEYRRLGMYVIKHTDGNIMPIIDQIVSCGAHALHSLDPQGGMDIAEVKRVYGKKVALCGNVNCGLLQTGTDRQALESCEYAMRHGKPGGGFIFCTSNCAFKGMPLERYEMMNQYWKQHRAY